MTSVDEFDVYESIVTRVAQNAIDHVSGKMIASIPWCNVNVVLNGLGSRLSAEHVADRTTVSIDIHVNMTWRGYDGKHSHKCDLISAAGGAIIDTIEFKVTVGIVSMSADAILVESFCHRAADVARAANNAKIALDRYLLSVTYDIGKEYLTTVGRI